MGKIKGLLLLAVVAVFNVHIVAEHHKAQHYGYADKGYIFGSCGKEKRLHC